MSPAVELLDGSWLDSTGSGKSFVLSVFDDVDAVVVVVGEPSSSAFWSSGDDDGLLRDDGVKSSIGRVL